MHVFGMQVARAAASASAFASGYFPLSPYPGNADDEETAGLLRVMEPVADGSQLHQVLQPLEPNFSARWDMISHTSAGHSISEALIYASDLVLLL